jgi:cation-transporting ATPase 13A1
MVAFSGATDFLPEMNRWLQIVEMESSVRLLVALHHCQLTSMNQFKMRLTAVMIGDFIGCWLIEQSCKYLFADLDPKQMILRGRERRELRRIEEFKRLVEHNVDKKRQ